MITPECTFQLPTGQKCRAAAKRGRAFCRHHDPAAKAAPAGPRVAKRDLFSRHRRWSGLNRSLPWLGPAEIPLEAFTILEALLADGEDGISDREAGRLLRGLFRRLGAVPFAPLEPPRSNAPPSPAAPSFSPALPGTIANRGMSAGTSGSMSGSQPGSMSGAGPRPAQPSLHQSRPDLPQFRPHPEQVRPNLLHPQPPSRLTRHESHGSRRGHSCLTDERKAGKCGRNPSVRFSITCGVIENANPCETTENKSRPQKDDPPGGIPETATRFFATRFFATRFFAIRFFATRLFATRFFAIRFFATRFSRPATSNWPLAAGDW